MDRGGLLDRRECDHLAWREDWEGFYGGRRKCRDQGKCPNGAYERRRLNETTDDRGSTQDVPPYKVVAGNPARIIKDVPRDTDAARTSGALAALERDRAAGK